MTITYDADYLESSFVVGDCFLMRGIPELHCPQGWGVDIVTIAPECSVNANACGS